MSTVKDKLEQIQREMEETSGKVYTLQVREVPEYIPMDSDRAAMVLCDLLLERGAPRVPARAMPLTGKYGYRASFVWPLMHVDLDDPLVVRLCEQAGLERELEWARKWSEGSRRRGPYR